MTQGIYLLRFNNSSKVYIGQSRDIEARYYKHLYRLKNNEANYKLQEHYKLFGIPKLEILCESDEDDMDSLENEAIQIYDSVLNGLNINSKDSGGGTGLQGERHKNSKYSNSTIYNVFIRLVENKKSFKQISTEFMVDISTVRDISKGKAHRWLKDMYPEKYSEMLDLVNTRQKNTYIDKYDSIPILVNGNLEIAVTNISEFSRKYGLNKSHVSGVINKKRKSHMGWILKQ